MLATGTSGLPPCGFVWAPMTPPLQVQCLAPIPKRIGIYLAQYTCTQVSTSWYFNETEGATGGKILTQPLILEHCTTRSGSGHRVG